MAGQDGEETEPAPPKLMREALLKELKRKGEDSEGRQAAKLQLVARALVDKALAGDMTAIRELNARIDAPGAKAASRKGPDPVKLLQRIERIIVRPEDKDR